MKRHFRDEQGASALELALVVPVLVMLVFGILEFGRAMATYSSVVTASREGARHGSTLGTNAAGTPNYRDCAGMRAAADRLNVLGQGSEIRVWFDTGPETAAQPVCTGPTAPTSVTPGHRVIVRVTKPFELTIPWVPGTFDISATDRRTVGGRAAQ
jgi:Flp pilus assembly protein TadG